MYDTLQNGRYLYAHTNKHMKKIIGFVLGSSILLVAGTALASPNNTIAGCNIPPDHGIASEDGTTWVGCIKAEVWNDAMAQAQAVSMQGVPTVAAGATIVDQHGVTDTCPLYYFHGCVNLTGTKWYIDDMNGIAKQLIAAYGSKSRATAAYPVFTGWINAQ